MVGYKAFSSFFLFSEWSEEDYDRKRYSHTPNYFFPKIERYPDLKTATIVFFACSLGKIHSEFLLNYEKPPYHLLKRSYCSDIDSDCSAL